MPHETSETLSALIDGELAAPDAARAEAHLASCAECSGLRDKLKGASTAFARSGVREVPLGLAARVKASMARRGPLPMRLAMATALGLLAILFAGSAFKKFAPTLLNNIQQMITGAAGQMGSGGGN